MPCLRIGPDYGSSRVCGVSTIPVFRQKTTTGGEIRQGPQTREGVEIQEKITVAPEEQRFLRNMPDYTGTAKVIGNFDEEEPCGVAGTGVNPLGEEEQPVQIAMQLLPDQEIGEVPSAPAQGLTLTGRHPSLHRNPTLPLDGEKKTRGGEQDPGGGNPTAHGVRRRHLVSQQPPRLGPRQIVAPPQGPRRVVAAVDTVAGKGQITASGACCRGHRPRQYLKTEAAAVSHTHQRHAVSAITHQPPPGFSTHPDMRRVVTPSIWAATRVRPARSPFERYAPGPDATGPRWSLPG